MKWFDFRKGFLILFVMILPLLSLNLQNKTLKWYFSPFISLASNMQNIYSHFTQNIQNTTFMYLNLIDIKKENFKLREEIVKMHTLKVKLTEIQIENKRLEQLLNFKNNIKQQSLAARVIAHDLLFGTHSTIRVNRGKQDGVEINQSAITPLGAVGVVFYAEKTFSDILVLTDNFSTIDAMVQRSRVRGVIVGKRGACIMQYLERTDDVQNGDLIITTGLDHIFPKGIPIGHVTKVQKRSHDISQQVEVEPLINPHNLEEVLIILNFPKVKNIQPLISKNDLKKTNKKY